MEEYKKSTLHKNSSLKSALIRLGEVPSTLTLFIVDDNNRLLGTLTDGDIRRGLLKGLNLDNFVEEFMYRDFKYLKKNESNFEKLKLFRELKLKAVPLIDGNGFIIKIYNFSVTKSILPIDAILMAGGKGSRLLPLTEKTPKPLLKIGGKEIISYNIDRLFQHGIINQNITLNYLGNQIENFCIDYNNEINFSFIKEPKFLGTAGSLSLINNFNNEVILLMNSDLLTNIDYEDFYKTFIDKEADMMVASVPYQINLPYAIFETENREIKALKEKPSYTYYANAGIYLFRKDILKYIPHNKIYNATDLMEKIVSQGKKLIHYPIRSYWLDIGKHVDFERAQKDIAHINWD